MCNKKYLVFLFFMQLFSSLWASDPQDNPLLYQIGFQQNLNSYLWLSQLHYKQTVLGKGLLRIGQNFNSSLIRLAKNDHKWKDDQQFTFNLFWPYSTIWGVNILASTYFFSDRLSGIVSDINTNWATIGFRLLPLSNIELNSEIGYKYDDRLARTDRGPTYGIYLKADPIVINDYHNQFYFLHKGDEYSIRKNNDFELQYRVKKHFYEDTIDSLSIFWTKKRRDNYDRINIDQLNIESLEEDNRGLQHALNYGVQGGIQFSLRNFIANRQTRVSKHHDSAPLEARSKKEFHSVNEIGMILQRSYAMVNLALSYETFNQKNDVPDSLKTKRFSKYFYYISPDFQSSRLTLSTSGKVYFKSDTLQLNGSISLYRYDTPENNVDDRDEFRFNVNISEIHHFGPNLKLVSNGSINLYHLVYIYGERSANNNWMRIFRLFPQIIYKPNENISITQHFEVLANYVDYDYDFGSSTFDLKSYVFRRFSFTQQVSVQITSKTGVFLNYNLELEENGKLDWDQWTEFLMTSRENHWLRSNINYRIKDYITLAPGFILYKRIEKQQIDLPSTIGSGEQDGSIFSFGPTLKVTYRPHQKMDFSFEGMRRFVTINSVQTRFINHFHISLTWYN